MVHELKTWPEEFEAILSSTKTCEARLDDRGFSVGDTLDLREWIPNHPNVCGWQMSGMGLSGEYTGRRTLRWVTHILKDKFGLPDGLAILSISTEAT